MSYSLETVKRVLHQNKSDNFTHQMEQEVIQHGSYAVNHDWMVEYGFDFRCDHLQGVNSAVTHDVMKSTAMEKVKPMWNGHYYFFFYFKLVLVKTMVPLLYNPLF